MKRVAQIITTLLTLLILTACGGTSSEDYLVQAKNSLASGDEKAAAIQLKNALQEDPDNAEARLILGNLYLEKGDMASAEKELRRARGLGYSQEEVSPLLAQAYAALNMHTELRDLTTPENSAGGAIVSAARGLSALTQGNNATAAEMIAEAKSLDPDSPYVLTASARLLAFQGELDKARSELNRTLEIDKTDITAWALLAEVEKRSRDPEAAEEAYSEAIEEDPENLSFRLSRTMLRLDQNDVDSVKEDIEYMIARAPRNPSVNYAQGIYQFYKEMYLEAVASLTIAEQDAERFPVSLLYLAAAHRALGNNNEAEVFAERYYALDPNNVAVRKLLAALAAEKGDNDRVVELIRPIVDQSPGDVGASNLLANALVKKGDIGQALDLLRKLADLDPESAYAQTRLGAGLLLLEGEQDIAIGQLENALKLDPGFQQAELLLVLGYLQKDDYANAIKAAQDYQARNPDAVTPHNLLGKIYLEQGRQEDALQAYKAALAIEPGDPVANQYLAAMSPLAEREPYYRAILKVDEDNYTALLLIAKNKEELGDTEGSMAIVRQVAESNPRAVEPRQILARYYISVNKSEQAMQVLNELDEDLIAMPDVQKDLAKTQLALNDYTAAEYTLGKLERSQPTDANIKLLLARAYNGQNKRAKTLAALNESIALAPDYSLARLFRARLLVAEGNLKDAAPDIRYFEENFPDAPDALKLRASIANKKGQHADALKYLKRNLAISPASDSVLALSQQQHLMGDGSGSLVTLQSWVDKNPNDTLIWTALGDQFAAEGRISDAVATYRQILSVTPDNFVVLNNVAWYLRSSEPDAALEYAQRAVEIAPDLPDALDTLAMVQLASGDTAEARKSIRRALEKQPENATLLFHSAQIDVETGESARAKRTLSKILDSGQNFPERVEAEKLSKNLGK